MSDDSVRVDVTRRQLLRGAAAVAAGAASVSAIANCTGGGGTSMPVDAGPVTNWPSAGTFHAGPVGSNVIIGRDAQGLYAYSSVCTHEGCAVPPPADATSNSSCPCHFSQFNSNGDVQPGSMALTSLRHYAVMINSGHVMVDTTMVLTDRSTRTPVT